MIFFQEFQSSFQSVGKSHLLKQIFHLPTLLSTILMNFSSDVWHTWQHIDLLQEKDFFENQSILIYQDYSNNFLWSSSFLILVLKITNFNYIKTIFCNNLYGMGFSWMCFDIVYCHVYFIDCFRVWICSIDSLFIFFEITNYVSHLAALACNGTS